MLLLKDLSVVPVYDMTPTTSDFADIQYAQLVDRWGTVPNLSHAAALPALRCRIRLKAEVVPEGPLHTAEG